MHIYKDFYNNTDFLKGKRELFISWICPILKSCCSAPSETIYYENEPALGVYFLKSKNPCHYVLPGFANSPFLRIVTHTSFGITEFASRILTRHTSGTGEIKISVVGRNRNHEQSEFSLIDENHDAYMFERLIRNFTVQAADEEYTELLMISKNDMVKLRNEFKDEFSEFFRSGVNEMEKIHQLRSLATDICEK